MQDNIGQQMILIIIALSILCRFNIEKYKKIKIKTLDSLKQKDKSDTENIINYIYECQKIKEINNYIYLTILIGILYIFFKSI